MNLRFELWFKNFLIVLAALLLWSIWASAQGISPLATVGFARAAFMVPENERMAVVTLRRTGETNAAVSVLLATVDGSAKAGVDYTAVSVVVR